MQHSQHPTLRKTMIAIILALLSLIAMVLVARERASESPRVAEIGVLTAAAATDVTGEQVYDMFLRVDTIQGQSADEKHRDQIEVDSFAWQEGRTRTAGKPSMESFRITMPVSKASPRLFLYVAGGIQIPKAVLSVRRRGAPDDFLRWTLTDVQPVSFRTVGNTHGDGVQDELVFSFSKVEVEYREPLPNGTLAPAIKAGWDQRTNKSVQ